MLLPLITGSARARLATGARGPVIAAGSTGSMPATAKFLHAIARLPQGAVVLPGLDTDLDEAAWNAIGGTRDAQGKMTALPSSNHPQFALHGRVGLINRDDANRVATGRLNFCVGIAFRRGRSWNPSNRQNAKATVLWPWESTYCRSTSISVQWWTTPSIIAATSEEEGDLICEWIHSDFRSTCQ